MFPASSNAATGKCSKQLPVKSVTFSDQYQAINAAVPSAQKLAKKYRVPVSVTLAQFALESGWGRYQLGANNFFGVKAQLVSSGGANDTKTERAALARTYSWGDVAVGCVVRKTTEYIMVKKGKKTRKKAITVWSAFRGYKNLHGSLEDHALFLVQNSRYAPAFKYANSPSRFAKEVGKAGYATDPAYASMLIKLIKQYKFTQYDVKIPAAR